MRDYNYDAFISYVHDSCEDYAERLYNRLSGAINPLGAAPRIFLDRDMVPGGDFLPTITRALKQSRHFLALITGDYFSSDYCFLEFRMAFEIDPSARNHFIVPLLIEDAAVSTIPTEYRRIQYVSLSRNAKDWYEKICEALELFDPRAAGHDSRHSPENRIQRGPDETAHSGPFRTPEGFLVVRGIHFAEVPGTSKSFWLSRTPVTVDQYRRLQGERRMPPPPPGNPNWAYPDHPIVRVNWDEANEFCRILGGRLPAFSEWLSAWHPYQENAQARSGSMVDLADLTASTQKTGLCSDNVPNQLGIYDLTGSVWEWCNDSGPAPNDRLICGGAATRAASRIGKMLRFPALGFRCLIEDVT
jgi:hypothetical protein